MDADFKVLITTSGVGSRLGDLTRYTNKALVRVGRKPVISYIVEAYPVNVPFVVTLGYYGKHVRDFLLLAYPERTFEFVSIDNYSGPGSSLVYSMLKAERFLRCPFVFHACDTIVLSKIPKPSYNWLGGYPSSNSNDYRSLSVAGGDVIKINEKGEINYDYDYIGLAGIQDYELFWETLKEVYEKEGRNRQLSDCHVINRMEKNFRCEIFQTWLDIGNPPQLKKARDLINEEINVLEKNDESIFIFDSFVIKFFYNKKTVRDRVKRVSYLNDCVPPIIASSENFYKYVYVQGDLFSEVANIASFSKFMSWAFQNLWRNITHPPINYYEMCLKFYRDKSLERINSMISNNNLRDISTEINGIRVPGALELMELINWPWICSAVPTTFHGDLILDNIIKTEDGFKLLDWRQDFGGSLEVGDIYYDLSKLNHNLTINHGIVQDDLYEISFDNNKVTCSIHISSVLQDCKQILHQFILNKAFDLKKVQVLSSLIWLNMSPLHHYPLNLFLYYFGRYNLYIHLNDVYDAS